MPQGMGNLGNILLPTMFGLGTAGNITGEIQKMIEQKRLADYQKSIMKMSPQTVAKNAASMAAPLNQGLTQAVGNQVQGAMAERGLSQAPGIYAGELSQSLAPYVQQNQNTALQAYLEKLQMPLGYQPTGLYGQSQDMTSLMKLWLQQMQGGGGSPNYTMPGSSAAGLGIDTTTPTFADTLDFGGGGGSSNTFGDF